MKMSELKLKEKILMIIKDACDGREIRTAYPKLPEFKWDEEEKKILLGYVDEILKAVYQDINWNGDYYFSNNTTEAIKYHNVDKWARENNIRGIENG